MTKVTAKVTFRGANFTHVYVAGNTYDFEDANAQALASQGLVEIVSEYKEVETAPKEEPKTEGASEGKTDEPLKMEAETAPKKAGRPKKV